LCTYHYIQDIELIDNLIIIELTLSNSRKDHYVSNWSSPYCNLPSTNILYTEWTPISVAPWQLYNIYIYIYIYIYNIIVCGYINLWVFAIKIPWTNTLYTCWLGRWSINNDCKREVRRAETCIFKLADISMFSITFTTWSSQLIAD